MNIHNENLTADWRKSIREQIDPKAEIYTIGIEGGGSINDARRVEASTGKYFVKLNEADPYPGMFEAEAKGLKFLRDNSEFEIPNVLGTGITDGIQWILMTYIEHAVKKADYWEEFGIRLARMHRQTNDMFGFEKDNYLGSLPQVNTFKKTWGEFYAENRIAPQLKMARDAGLASDQMVKLLEKVISRAETYFPVEPPAVLHGDLWTGNFATTISGEATIFDPAAHYGHREMDISMSKLFGGFNPRFYEAYNAEYPLKPGWEERLPIADLYPLLAHLNIFGGTYAFQIMNLLRQNV